MNKVTFAILIVLLIGGSCTNSSDDTKTKKSTEDWDNYIATYEEEKLGSTTFRKDLIDDAPLQDFPYLLVTGVNYETSRTDGFPENETFDVLHEIGGELIELIGREVASMPVGSFTHDQERLEYFYIRDTANLQEVVENFYQQQYPDYEYYLNIKEDREWKSYRTFLYPNEATLNYMADESIIEQLQESGDLLTKERRVDHWLYFPTAADRNNCEQRLKQRGYSAASSSKNEKADFPFELQVWKIHAVDMNAVYPITNELREMAETYNGEYDGWETEVIRE
jgi:hypothetical protein